MIAAIYARLSKDKFVNKEAMSTTRQVEHARKFAADHGWTVADDLVFIDDDIGGAEFAARPGFVRLMNTLKPRAPFSVLVMSESSRLGREQFETGYALKQLSQAGVRCFSYLDDEEIVLDTATDKFMMSAATFAAELERERARQRVTDTMARKAARGDVCGGRVFGYTNRDVLGPDGKRSHVERVIHPEEATVVRRIFELSATGTGFTRIAKLLNEERALCPRPMLRPDGAPRPAGWAPSTVRAILLRPLYRGEPLYNMTKKKDQWGQRKTSDRPEREWIRAQVPALRVVSDQLWNAAQARLVGIKTHLATVNGGRPGRRRDRDSEYLLTGFARCAICGGSLCVMNRTTYACMTFHKRGTTVCDNTLRKSMDRVNEALVTELLKRTRPNVVLPLVLDHLKVSLSPRARATDLEKARATLATVEREIGNLTRAIAIGGDLETLVEELRTREARRQDLQTLIAASATVPRYDRQAIEREVRTGLESWRTLLSGSLADGRQFLREVLEGPILFTPDGDRYRFDLVIGCGRLVSGVVDDPRATSVVRPAGLEPATPGLEGRCSIQLSYGRT